MTDAADHFVPLRRELDAWQAAGLRASLWWRDDDTIEPTPALKTLLALQQDSAVPLALAVVPARASKALPSALGDGALAVLQHGYAHENHAPPTEKKSELGVHRPAPIVIGELATGWDTLSKLFGPRALPVLVPPWNRIAPYLVPMLPELHYAGLSSFGPRQRRHPVRGLLAVNAHVDVIDWRGGRGFVGHAKAVAALCERLAARREATADRDEPTGLLTHHLVHDRATWSFLTELFAQTVRHPGAIWLHAGAVFGLNRP